MKGVCGRDSGWNLHSICGHVFFVLYNNSTIFSDLLSLCLGPTRPGSSYFIPDPDLLNYCQKTRCYGPPRMFILPGLGPQGSDAQANEPSASPIWSSRGSLVPFAFWHYILLICNSRRGVSPETNPAGTLILDLQLPELWGIAQSPVNLLLWQLSLWVLSHFVPHIPGSFWPLLAPAVSLKILDYFEWTVVSGSWPPGVRFHITWGSVASRPSQQKKLGQMDAAFRGRSHMPEASWV